MDKIKIYKKERELLLDLLGKYEPKTKLEESVKYSVECKIRKAYNYSHLIPVSIAEVEEKLKGITCGFKSTSCGDQLAQACLAALEAQKQEA